MVLVMKINIRINLGIQEEKHIGLQFGSYNPPHLAHVQTAKNLKKAGGLTEVWLLPIPQSPYKKEIEQVPFAEKVEMCQILAEPFSDWLKVSDVCGHFPNTATGQLQQYKRTIEGLIDENPRTKFSIVAGEDFSKKYNEVVAGMAYLSMIVNSCKQMSIFNFQMLDNFADRIIRANEVLQKLDVLSAPRATLPVQTENGIVQQPVSSKLIREQIPSGVKPDALPDPLWNFIKERKRYSERHPS